MAPEIHRLLEQLKSPMKGNRIEVVYDPEKADVFSLGILLASLCCLEIVDSQMDKGEIGNHLSIIQERYPKIHAVLVDMLHSDPGMRKPFRKLYEKLSTHSAEMTKLPFCELEFVSELKATDTEERSVLGFEKTYAAWVSKGESNMKNNLYGEAIACFLKVYEMIKRGDLPFSKEYTQTY